MCLEENWCTMIIFFWGGAPQHSDEMNASLSSVLRFALPLLVSGSLPLAEMSNLFSVRRMGFLLSGWSKACETRSGVPGSGSPGGNAST